MSITVMNIFKTVTFKREPYSTVPPAISEEMVIETAAEGRQLLAIEELPGDEQQHYQQPQQQQQICSSHAEIRLNALRCTIAQQCIDSGWHGITESSLAALVDVLDRYLKTMAKRIASYTELAGREEPLVQDFRLALRDVEPSASLKDIHSFCTNIRNSPLDTKLFYPLPAESEIYTAPNFDSVAAMTQTCTPVVAAADSGQSDREREEAAGKNSRPDWMDQDLIFPPIDQWLPVTQSASATEKQLSTLDDSQRGTVTLADIIIGADDEDMSEYQSAVTVQVVQPGVSAAPTKAECAWPRKLKSISVVNGQLITTKEAPQPQARLPVELKPSPSREPKIAPMVLNFPEKRKKDAKKDRTGESSSKKLRLPAVANAPAEEPTTAPFTPESLKFKFAKPGKKTHKTPVPGIIVPHQVKPESLEYASKTPPEPRDVFIPPPLPQAPTFQPEPIKLKPTAGFSEAWKQGKKERSEKSSSSSSRHGSAGKEKSDRDREKEREIRRALERDKERELEEELKRAALPKPSKPHAADFEPAVKKHKKHHHPVEYPQRLPVPNFYPKLMPPLPVVVSHLDAGDGSRKHHSHHDEESSRKSEKKRKRESEKQQQRLEEVPRPVEMKKEVKKEAVTQRSWVLPDTVTAPYQPPSVQSSSKSKKKDKTHFPGTLMELATQKDAFLPTPPVNYPPIPKLTLKLGGKDIKTIKSSAKSTPEFLPSPRTSAPSILSPRESHRPVQAAFSYDATPAAPLDLSMSSRSAVAAPAASQPVKSSSSKLSSKSSSKGSSSHGGNKGKTVADSAPPSPAVIITKVAPPPKTVVVPPPKTVVPPPKAVVAPPPKAVVVPAASVPEEEDMQEILPEELAEPPQKWYCPLCKQEANEETICCDTCEEWYHFVCVNIVTAPGEDEKWFCPTCMEKQLLEEERKRRKNKKGKKH
ncbi:hypothetical protein BV898_02272 [Hypsibius exemplaris]|uniref:PHD-type domain-containing protein n=1 Tax=Hypsibius exemplaris TaxID=2072580 RepID=A0A1W0X958_HYPEX|nr:hypothetical protein BV898_02272 [Hypsibius exemplaris]